jgi:hypothetical protein
VPSAPSTPPGSGISSTRTFRFAANAARASSVYAGAISTSTNCLETACAHAPSTGRLNATMPPKAEVGSVRNARAYASPTSAPTATPHGFACLTITQPARRSS